MMIYLDNAATTSPKPERVVREVDRAMRQYSANPGRGGHKASLDTAKAVFDTRTLVKDFFNMESEEGVIFTPGCTASLNMVIKGVLRKGDHVVISCLEHNAVLRPLHKLKQHGFIDYTVADVVIGDDEATLQSFRSAINARTRMIICTHASNAFGIRLPVERLCALAHSYGILFCMDAAQSAGVLDIKMTDAGYDIVCCAGHKGLYGPMGIGLLLINCDVPMNTLIEGGTGSESFNPAMPGYLPDRFESGTLNIPGICGLGAGIRFVQTKHRERIAEHEMKLIRYAYHRLKNDDRIILYTPEPELEFSAPVLSLNIRNHDSEEVSKYLSERFGIATRAGLHCAPLAHNFMGTSESGTVRVAPSVFSTQKEIQILCDALKNFSHSS